MLQNACGGKTINFARMSRQLIVLAAADEEAGMTEDT
jgi:hypothetical protein